MPIQPTSFDVHREPAYIQRVEASSLCDNPYNLNGGVYVCVCLRPMAH